MDLKAERTRLTQMVADAKRLHGEIETAGDKAGQEDRNKLAGLIADGKVLRARIDEAQDLEELTAYTSAPTGRRVRETAGGPRQRKSWGQLVIESEQFKGADRRADAPTMGPVDVKALYEATDATGGALIQTQHLAELTDVARQQPRRVLPLINRSQTNSDSVEYPRLITRTNAAAPVLEYDSGWVSAPESNLVFDLATAQVKPITTYVAASMNILDDAPQLRSIVDDELTYMLDLVLEQEVLAGDGTGAHFTGILNWSGLGSRVHRTSGRNFDPEDTILDTIRKGITDIVLAFYEADAIVLYPEQAEEMELDKDANGRYTQIYDPVLQRVWRVPVIDTPAITSGTALVGNFKMGATIWDRMQTMIRVGQPGSYFLQNAVAVLAILRAAFAVKRPLAFEKITSL